MMFLNDNTFFGGQDPQGLQYAPYPPIPVLPHAVGSIIKRERSFESAYGRHLQSPAASSTSRTAKSGHWNMMPPKRTSSGSPSSTPGKVVKTEQKAEDFSNSVKKRLATSSRTGQACDRCKVRKIRCDGLLGGCSPCLQNQTECRTTDRITGRAAPRGYVDNLENQNRDMSARIQELEALLIQNGIDVKQSNPYHGSSMQSYNSYNVPSQNGSSQMWNGTGSSNAYVSTNTGTSPTTTIQQETNMFRALPNFRSGCTGDNYLGVSAGTSSLSSIKGTALSILGMEIDVADFPSSDMDEPDPAGYHPALYNKSYQAFLLSALSVNPRLDKVDLPAREEGLTYFQWYFRVINAFCPILHKGTTMALLSRFYDDPNFQPTTAQTVVIHMVFAIMFFQYATRNWEDSVQQNHLTTQSNMHYHYSLGMFYQLVSSHTYQDVQALTLICLHQRNFPKPGASWILSSITMSLAIELGMHRSVKRWSPEHTPNVLDIEMRKRTFWSILAVHVTLSGKLGRPMQLKAGDFDIELPEPIDDDLLSEAGIDTSRTGKCIHSVGLLAFRILPLFMEMYSTIYAVRRTPETYIQTVSGLEAKLRAWQDSHPPEIMKGESGFNEQEGRVFALYTEIWACEFRLLLRHPSVSMSIDPAFNAESMKICMETSHHMLGVVSQLQKLKSLDTTWYNTSVYVMAITLTLFAHWEKRSETTASELATLRSEMDTWLDIMADVGALLGSGVRLRDAVRVVTDGTLGLLSRSLQSNQTYVGQASNHDASNKISHRRKPSATPSIHAYSNYNTPYPDTNGAGNGNSTSPGYLSSDNQMPHQSTPYPAATQYSNYPDPTVNNSSLSYSTQDPHTFTSYQPTSTDSVEAPLLAAFAAQAASQTASSNWSRTMAQQPSMTASGSQSWQQWTSTMSAGNLEPQDRYSASALMQLGGRDLSSAATDGSSAPLADMTSAQASVMGQDTGTMGSVPGNSGIAWPLNIFDIGHGGNTS